jgi:hypothetical protein
MASRSRVPAAAWRWARLPTPPPATRFVATTIEPLAHHAHSSYERVELDHNATNPDFVGFSGSGLKAITESRSRTLMSTTMAATACGAMLVARMPRTWPTTSSQTLNESKGRRSASNPQQRQDARNARDGSGLLCCSTHSSGFTGGRSRYRRLPHKGSVSRVSLLVTWKLLPLRTLIV